MEDSHSTSETPPASTQVPSTNAEDVKFVNAMTAAGLLLEMSADELEHTVHTQTSGDPAKRCLDILERYYGANGDANVGLRRRMTDRFFMHRADDPVTARQLIVRLALLAPEVGKISLERIGEGDDGTYVLKAGEHFGGIVDDEAEDGGQDPTGTLTVRALVRAVNVLLERSEHRYRFIPLLTDDTREAYVATTVAGALNLCQEQYLEESDVEALMHFASW